MKLVLIIIAALALSLTARADEIYNYRGNPFTQQSASDGCRPLDPPCPAFGGFLGISIDLAQPLAPNTSMSVTPLSFLISGAGPFFYNLSFTQSTFFLETDSQGRIINWSILVSQHPDIKAFHTTMSSPSGDSDFDIDGIEGNELSNFDNPGTWTMTPTPEPWSALLLASGLAFVGFVQRYKSTVHKFSA